MKASRWPKKWKPLNFSTADYLRYPRKRHGPIKRRGTSKTFRPTYGESELEQRAAKLNQLASLPERIMYKALMQRRIPFDFQSSMQGGRAQLGGMVVDFLLLDRRAVIRVQGDYWHSGVAEMARDEVQKCVLESLGYDVWDIWDYEVYDIDRFDDWMRRHFERGSI